MDKLVLHVPEWQGELIFSREVVMFLGVILLLIVGTLFCFWGYKYFRTVLFVGIGTVAAYGSYLLVEPMTEKLVIRMFLTVTLTFLGVCFAYFIDIVFCYFLDRLRIRNKLGKLTWLFTAPLGAALLGLTVYFCVWRDAPACGIGAGICLMAGLIFQYRKRKKTVRFRSYNDLLRLPLPRFDEDGLEYIAMEAVPKVETVSDSTPEIVSVHPLASKSEPQPAPASAYTAIPAMLVIPEEGSATVATAGLSDSVKSLIAGKLEVVDDVLEDALFVKVMKDVVVAERYLKEVDMNLAAIAAGRHVEITEHPETLQELATFIQKEADAVQKEQHIRKRAADGSGRNNVSGSLKKSGRIRKNRWAKNVAIATVAGVGLFVAGRASKGGK